MQCFLICPQFLATIYIKDKFRVDWFRSTYKGVVFDSDIDMLWLQDYKPGMLVHNCWWLKPSFQLIHYVFLQVSHIIDTTGTLTAFIVFAPLFFCIKCGQLPTTCIIIFLFWSRCMHLLVPTFQKLDFIWWNYGLLFLICALVGAELYRWHTSWANHYWFIHGYWRLAIFLNFAKLTDT